MLQVLAPYDSEDARGLLKAAIRDPDPVIFLENEILYGQAFPVSQEVRPAGQRQQQQKQAQLHCLYPVAALQRLCKQGRCDTSWLQMEPLQR